MGRAATAEALLTLLEQAARAALRAGAGLPGPPPADVLPVQADGGADLQAAEAFAAYVSSAHCFRAGDRRSGWAALEAATEARAVVVSQLCPAPRRDVALAETTLHLALARRGQGMPSDRGRLAAAAAAVEAVHALRPEPMTAALADLLRRADDPGETLETLAARAAGARPPACRRGERADGAARG
jgi:hypothetical protein